MQAIRDSFKNEVGATARHAMGVHCILGLGRATYVTLVRNYLDADVHIGTEPPGAGGGRRVRHVPTHREVLDAVPIDSTLTLELFHGVMIQQWLGFLRALYREVIRRELQAPGTYDVSRIELRLDVAGLDPAQLQEAVAEAASTRFDFGTVAKEKLKEVARMLKISLSVVENDVVCVRQNVVVRNVLQHNHGILRASDLAELGARSLPSDDGKQISDLAVGDRVRRTPFDVDNCAHAMLRLADVLVP